MLRAPHLFLEAIVGQGLSSRAPGDVLAVRPVRVTLRGVAEVLQTGLEGLAVGGVVTKVAAIEHLLGVGAGRLRKGVVRAERFEPVVGAGLVVQVQHPLLGAVQLDGFPGTSPYGDEVGPPAKCRASGARATIVVAKNSTDRCLVFIPVPPLYTGRYYMRGSRSGEAIL